MARPGDINFTRTRVHHAGKNHHSPGMASIAPGATMTKAYMLLSSSSAATDFTSSKPSKLTVMEVGSSSSLASAIGCSSSTDFDRGPFHGRSSDTADRGGRGGCFSSWSATKYVAPIFLGSGGRDLGGGAPLHEGQGWPLPTCSVVGSLPVPYPSQLVVHVASSPHPSCYRH